MATRFKHIFRTLQLPAVMVGPSPILLFRVFFLDAVLQDIARHTNTKGRYRTESLNCQWQHDIYPQELETLFGLLLGMGIVRLPAITDYWSHKRFLGHIDFKSDVLPWFNAIMRALWYVIVYRQAVVSKVLM